MTLRAGRRHSEQKAEPGAEFAPQRLPARRFGQYGLLLWRSDGSSAPTELHLPASFPTATTTVVSDLGTSYAPPAYTRTTPIAAAPEPGGAASRRLLLTAP
jgi:hypothetical protein